MNYIIIIISLFIFIKFFFFAKKYMYEVTIFSGKTGSGKTMLATSKALKRIKKGMPVYSTFYLDGAFKLPYNFYDYNFPEDSTLIIDETQISLDSRDYKSSVANGISSKLTAKLSMHRHQKLDIWFITQQPENIDKRIRSYCGRIFFCSNTILKRKFIIEDKSLNLIILPYFQHYEIWPDIDTYELYKKRFDPTMTKKIYGVRKAFQFIGSCVFTKYNTYQQDVASVDLKLIKDILHDDPDSLIDTKNS